MIYLFTFRNSLMQSPNIPSQKKYTRVLVTLRRCRPILHLISFRTISKTGSRNAGRFIMILKFAQKYKINFFNYNQNDKMKIKIFYFIN